MNPSSSELFITEDSSVHAVTRSKSKDTQIQEEALQEVPKPYISQVKDILTEDKNSQLKELSSVNLSIPLDILAKSMPDLASKINESLTVTPTNIHHLSKLNNKIECTYVDILVNNYPVRAIVDSGAPINIISTKLVSKIGLKPDLEYSHEYGTAGTHSVMSKGAYSSLPLTFGNLSISAPAIVTPNSTCDILIGTAFMKEFGVKLFHETDTFEILNHKLPLLYSRDQDSKKKNILTMFLRINYSKFVFLGEYML